MRWNGWQRIGIVASVIWAVGAYFVAMGQENYAERRYRLCTAAVDQGSKIFTRALCLQQHEENLPEARAINQKVAIAVALVPIPIGWLVVYVVVWVVRWVRRGFKPAT